MQPPPSPSINIPIDPALSIYPSYYSHYPPHHGHSSHGHPHHLPSHLTLPPNYSSPSSQGSDTLGTPPTELAYPENLNGKRSASGDTGGSRKKRKEEGNESVSLMAEKDEGKPKPTRGSRACTVCRRLKMKCVGAEQGGPCKRCMSGNHECIFEESNRGKRSSKKHELLTRSLRKMERTLDTVLRSIGNPAIASGIGSRSPSPTAQAAGTSALIAASPSPPPERDHRSPHSARSHSLSHSSSHPHSSHHRHGGQIQEHPGSPKLHSLPDNALNPLGLLAEASLANRRAQHPHASPLLGRIAEGGDCEAPKVGVASDNYFKPGPMTILPLRRLYIERQVQPEMLSFVGTEDVFYTAKPELHPRLTELAKKLAFSVPAQGYKSVEIVQSYLLLSLWGCGAVERYEQDKTWLLLGMAIRMATDLNLHRKTAVTSQDTQEGRARELEVHNRERTWIMCFCLDRSFSAQMGKPHSIKEDAIIRNADKWCYSPVAAQSDASLPAYAELQRILSRCLDFLYSGTDTPSGLQIHCDYMLVIKSFEAQLDGWVAKWVRAQEWEGEDPASIKYKKLISQFYYNYAMLVLNSFGLQNALEREPVDIGHFFARCHSSATICATLVRDGLGPSGFMKNNSQLIRPEFQAFLKDEQKILRLVSDVADTLETSAANHLHTPALYSHFLRALVASKTHKESNEPDNVNGVHDGNTDPSNTSFPNQNHGNDVVAGPAVAFSGGTYTSEGGFSLADFHLDGEMGPVADISTFPPTMAPNPPDSMNALTMDNILSTGFWDSMLVPGYNSMDGLSGGFLFGAGGSGLITPRFGMSPIASGTNTPARPGVQNLLTQMSINAAFNVNHKSGTTTPKVES
ncbi:hypothetical protein DXG03_009197 [Asterophora parasitica]|uniref:Zn(2)-C6 fungal-type domain-containing protein n=1 Tax=Asterophora parasitica TaxID=117018 RepID=A0A9P7G760_9AGAR|nr:hypothetical protein DXG03_009197 [Asterophora parasitica]